MSLGASISPPTDGDVEEHRAAQRIYKDSERLAPKPVLCVLAAMIEQAQGNLVVDDARTEPRQSVRQYERSQRARANSRLARMASARTALLAR